jgi:hypothetical protein
MRWQRCAAGTSTATDAVGCGLLHNVRKDQGYSIYVHVRWVLSGKYCSTGSVLGIIRLPRLPVRNCIKAQNEKKHWAEGEGRGAEGGTLGGRAVQGGSWARRGRRSSGLAALRTCGERYCCMPHWPLRSPEAPARTAQPHTVANKFVCGRQRASDVAGSGSSGTSPPYRSHTPRNLKTSPKSHRGHRGASVSWRRRAASYNRSTRPRDRRWATNDAPLTRLPQAPHLR